VSEGRPATGGGPRRLAEILERALDGQPPAGLDIATLLAVTDPDDAAALFAAAGELRRRHFGDAVFLYGFVYFSTYCHNECTFCLYRSGNPESPRYRKSLDEVVAIACGLAASGVHLIDLTMGEDPLYFATNEFDALVELVRAVKEATGLPVMISPGKVSADVLGALRDAGADQETHAPGVYARLRVGQDFAARAAARTAAARLGMLVEDGMLLGVGETVGDRALTVAAMRDEPVDQVRVMSFVPQRGTPLEHESPAGSLGELVTIATMRLVMPDRLIPATLDVDGINGLEPRIVAGANVVTSIVPPDLGLAGVSQSELDIDAGLRTAAEASARLTALGLRAATAGEYAGWVAGALERRVARR
jgi:methylornithine synthase